MTLSRLSFTGLRFSVTASFSRGQGSRVRESRVNGQGQESEGLESTVRSQKVFLGIRHWLFIGIIKLTEFYEEAVSNCRADRRGQE